MLAAEEAKAVLVGLGDDEWRVAAEKRVRKLKRNLRTIAAPLLAPNPDHTHAADAREKWRNQQWQAGSELDDLTPKRIEAVMSALHPQLGPTLAYWWVAAQGQPYGRYWSRRGFRAPNHPELTRTRRIDDLTSIVNGAGPYAQPPEWFATWAPFLELANRGARLNAYSIGPLLAAAIDAQEPSSEAVLQTLIDSGNGDHPVGGMGRHVIVGLLRCSRPEAWKYIESMLIAAQRQEGLRQSILEAADEAHPAAFNRILDLTVSENLIRFAATIRAISVWLGFTEDAEHVDDAAKRLGLLQTFRADRDLAIRRALEGDPWETYAALCALGQTDVADALEVAHAALQLPDRNNRSAALRFVANAQLPHATSMPIFASMAADVDLAVASQAHQSMGWVNPIDRSVDVYDTLNSLARRLPEKATTDEPVGIDPGRVPLDRDPVVATMIRLVGKRPLEPLLEFVPSMKPDTRGSLMKAAGERRRLDGDMRAAVVKMVGDKSTYVRKAAVDAMDKVTPNSQEAPELEALLTRKAGDLRRGVIGLLSRLPVVEAIASAQRLWTGSGPQRDAACELLDTIERTDDVVAVAEAFQDGDPTPMQLGVLEAIVVGTDDASDDITLGLYEVSELTAPQAPSKATDGRIYVDNAALAIVEALDDLAHTHRNTAFQLVNWQGKTEILLGDAQWLPSPWGQAPAAADDTGGWGMVMPEVFRGWWHDRPDECRGESDALDALRAIVAIHLCSDTPVRHGLHHRSTEVPELLRPLVGSNRLSPRYPSVVLHVLNWLLTDFADRSVIGECVAATEVALAAVPRRWVKRLVGLDVYNWQQRSQDWRADFADRCPWMVLTAHLFVHDPFLLTSDQITKWYGLMRWFDQPIAGAPRRMISPLLLHAAHAIGTASDADVYEDFIGTHDSGRWGGNRQLLVFTKRRRDQIEARHPTIVPLADRVRHRVLEIERTRGELSTPASHLAFQMASIEGADVTLELLARLGRSTLVRGYQWKNDGRDGVYSRLLQISHPSPTDTPEVLTELIARHKMKDLRLVELAMFAPQWAPLIESALDWDGLEDAIWWFHAHTKDDRWAIEAEVRETWAAMSAERTPLTAADLTDGAVDVDWFARAHDRLGAERWKILHKSAKLAAGGAGHRRAQTFAEAMLGELDEDAVASRLQTKRHQDSARALGLLPIPSKGAAAVALRRYQILREFERGSKKFGQQRQHSEANAVRIGIENLARATGAADPQRFIWAMEANEAGDLADGPVSVTHGDLTVTLLVDPAGSAEISVQRGDKRLKSVPAKLRKHPPIKALTDRKTALKRQASRVRRSLEEAMVRQDHFSNADFKALRRHPVVSPMLQLIVWVDADGSTFRRRGATWLDVTGAKAKPKGRVRIAHPVDLVGTGHWIDWQERLFADAEKQPFKQVFRELYLMTDAEASDSPISRRWSGHQLQSRQAAGLFTSRGWLSDYDAGQVAKVFHHVGLVARVSFVDGWGTPAEVELPTVDAITFTNRGEHLVQPLTSVPPVLFSETMRDLDLVVSVAHAGGVDPEASASTVEMRAALVRQTTRLLRLDNVSHESNHVVIEGSLGEYAVHLGSGTVHRRPGGALCIIPVDAQRRGRVFLPFADDDPRSAEIVSKVLLLAEDSKIKDPTILEQLRS